MALGGSAVAGRRRHVLLFPLAYQGHINPMFRLAGILHGRGFAITVFHTHFNAPDPSRHPEYRFVAVPDGMSGPAPVAIEDVVSHILALNAACKEPFREHLAAILDEYSRDAVACLIADTHLLSMVEVATELSVHTLVLRTGSAACLSCFLAYPLLVKRGYLPVQESELETEVSELPPYRVRDLMRLGKRQDLTCKLLERVVGAVKASSGLILNTFDALERRELEKLRQDLPMPVFDIGPLHLFSPAAAAGSSLLRQDPSCLMWLDARPAASVLYVSFGSLACMTARDLVETAWGIARSGVPFLWVVRPGLVAADGMTRLPDGFEAATRGRGMVVEWAPQEEVLRHAAVGGFWTHGGWNSTTESLCEGVPMLCRPHFGDQMGNARYVEHVWRVGFEVAGALERGGVEAAIRRLVTGEEGAQMRARAGELKKAAKECTGDAGSSGLAIGGFCFVSKSTTSTRTPAASINNPPIWFFDTCSTYSMTGDPSLLLGMHPAQHVTTSSVTRHQMSSYQCGRVSGAVNLSGVRYFPGAPNLISNGHLLQLGCNVTIDSVEGVTVWKDGIAIGRGCVLQNKMTTIDLLGDLSLDSICHGCPRKLLQGRGN